VVRAGVILGTGVNSERRDGDPTAHAEVAAIRDACRRLGTLRLAGAAVVSSCEPCAICHAVAVSVGVARIVYAAPKELVPDLGGDPPGPHAELLPRMQAALRATAPEQVVHVPTEGDDEPFRRYLAARRDAAGQTP
jgi:tRNA(Arg) A34 adenosine deaminase TadA